MNRIAYASIAALFFASSIQIANAKEPAPMLKDGELKVPADYKSWPKFLTGVDRPDLKQVRDIYINPIGAGVKPGEKFPNGTISVMELYKAELEADGSFKKSKDGKLVKGALLKVFVMGKDAGWGELAPAGLKTGDWSYSGYMADAKTPTADAPAACRGCHLPLGDAKDFIARYDEYFQKR
jgi:hypothetical protein